jgi:hypothetical protein
VGGDSYVKEEEGRTVRQAYQRTAEGQYTSVITFKSV